MGMVQARLRAQPADWCTGRGAHTEPTVVGGETIAISGFLNRTLHNV